MENIVSVARSDQAIELRYGLQNIHGIFKTSKFNVKSQD